MNSDSMLGVPHSENENIFKFSASACKIGKVLHIAAGGSCTFVFSELPQKKFLEHYELVTTDNYPTSVIGDGIEGTIYLAKHSNITSATKHSLMAIKKIKDPETSEYNLNAHQALYVLYHVELVANILHTSYIVKYEDVFFEYSAKLNTYECYLVMKYYRDGTLADIIHKRKMQDSNFTNAEMVRFGLQLAHGVLAIHEVNLMHRDLKPTNVLVTKNESLLKIADFGRVKEYFADVQHSVAGTQLYCAPEVMSQTGTYSQAVDIFSLGCIFVEMMTFFVRHYMFANSC